MWNYAAGLTPTAFRIDEAILGRSVAAWAEPAISVYLVSVLVSPHPYLPG